MMLQNYGNLLIRQILVQAKG